MTHCRFALAISLALLAASPSALAANGDHSKVNGTIRVDAGERAGDLDTVNGSIKIDTGAQVGDAETVNGSIRVADTAHAGALSTVNGSIRTGREVVIGGDVGTVNGSVFFDRGGNVGGDVETVGSHVRGGIHYAKPGQQWISFNRRDPRVIIGPNARVDGPLVFERDVKLYVHESAQIGTVTGASAIRYQGDHAPTGK